MYLSLTSQVIIILPLFKIPSLGNRSVFHSLDPIVIEVGDIKNKSQAIEDEDALEPMQLMLRAIQTAIKDA